MVQWLSYQDPASKDLSSPVDPVPDFSQSMATTAIGPPSKAPRGHQVRQNVTTSAKKGQTYKCKSVKKTHMCYGISILTCKIKGRQPSFLSQFKLIALLTIQHYNVCYCSTKILVQKVFLWRNNFNLISSNLSITDRQHQNGFHFSCKTRYWKYSSAILTFHKSK